MLKHTVHLKIDLLLVKNAITGYEYGHHWVKERVKCIAVESAIKENKQQWDVEKNENPFVLPTRLLYLNSVALLRYPDGSLPILEDGSIDPNYIRLTGIPAEELLVLIDNGLLSQVKRRFEVEV